MFGSSDGPRPVRTPEAFAVWGVYFVTDRLHVAVQCCFRGPPGQQYFSRAGFRVTCSSAALLLVALVANLRTCGLPRRGSANCRGIAAGANVLQDVRLC